MSEERSKGRFAKLALEALGVAAGVLLAFSVDAWWERVQEQDVVDGLRSAAALEAAENRAVLALYAEGGDVSLNAARTLIEMIGPEPEVVPLDSVLPYMGRLLTYGAAPLEFGATDRLLASGDVEELLDPDFHARMVRFRSRATRYADEGLRFDRIHEELVVEFGRVAPLAVLSASKPGVHGPTDFPVDVQRILTSPSLEGAVGNLAVWVDNLDRRVDQLLTLSDSLWVGSDGY